MTGFYEHIQTLAPEWNTTMRSRGLGDTVAKVTHAPSGGRTPRIPAPAPDLRRAITDEDLAVCRGGCPDYEQVGVSGFRCWEGFHRGSCSRGAIRQWLDRWFGKIPPCERQLAAGLTTLERWKD